MISETTDVTGSLYSDSSISQVSNAASQLNRDAFLNLLITQIKYQDPLKPMEDKEFIAQLAQFSSLEQMQQVNQNLALLAQMDATAQASSLIGKQITAVLSTDGSVVSGRVSAVDFVEGKVLLTVGTTKVSPADVTRIEQ
jgi:flagellar basal-body rod modification protein FlgD